MIEKIEGIKSVDFKIIAKGHGVVNWNGSLALRGKDGKEITNHTMPKLRGYTNLTGEVKDKGNDKVYEYKKTPYEVDFQKTPLYISSNAIRFHLFKNDGVIDINKDEVITNPEKLLCSLTGLVRGYVIPSKEYKRTSALLLEDLVDQLGNGNYEQMTRAGSKEKVKTKKADGSSNSLFSKTTFGNTLYEGYGSISVEQLQFIPISDDFSRNAIKVNNEKEGKDLADTITQFLKALDASKSPEATFALNYVRVGSIYNYGEGGILLNDDAIDILINKTLNLINHLMIRQGKGYMYVDSLEIDYNEAKDYKDNMRIKPENPNNSNIKNTKHAKYSIYYKAQENAN